jgi:hypothetical protein
MWEFYRIEGYFQLQNTQDKQSECLTGMSMVSLRVVAFLQMVQRKLDDDE